MIDTHAHLQHPIFSEDREAVIERARKAGIESIINVGFDMESSERATKLAEQKELYAAVGIHPHNARDLNYHVLEKLRKLSKNDRVVAIGEVGLDYYRNLASREIQRKAFIEQLCLAREEKLPVIIHNRDAHRDVLEILSKFDGEINGVMHCFSGNKEIADRCIKLNFFISFAGTITFPNAKKLHKIAATVDLRKLILETDSPWLAPQDHRGERNEPAFLPSIAKKIADLNGIPVRQVAAITTKNAKEILQLP